MRSAVLVLTVLLSVVAAREAPPNGPRRIKPGAHFLIGATLHIDPETTQADTTLLLRNGRIAAIGGTVPDDARVWDAHGLHVYSGFIDAHVGVDVSDQKGEHWNTKVRPQRRAHAIPNATAGALRKLGFTAAVAAPKSGILRGRATLISLSKRDADRSKPRPLVHGRDVYQSIGLERFDDSNKGYPTSLMGAIAVIRQSLHDGLLGAQPLVFDTEDELDALRVTKIGREFKRRTIVLGSGLEFRRIAAMAAERNPIIAPVRLPPAPDVSSVGAIEAVDLREMMTWEQAPTNLRRLDEANVPVALTTSKLKNRTDFWKSVRQHIAHGLKPERAYAMLSATPASMLGAEGRLGSISIGKLAHLVVADRPLFTDKEARILSVWIDGERYELAKPRTDVLGKWQFGNAVLEITGKNRAVLVVDKKRHKARRVAVAGQRIHLAFDLPDGALVVSAEQRGEDLVGQTIVNGERAPWGRIARRIEKISADKEDEDQQPDDDDELDHSDVPANYGYPFGPYARVGQRRPPKRIIIAGATVWTCGQDGIIADGQVDIAGGEIVYVGKRNPVEGDGIVTIDAKGMHLTPGIIDCHSHTGISRGVNDSGQAVTAEVRIGDVTNPDAISWYRQLACGVTTVNSLHGSANPIGGQNQVNKVRWGVTHPDQMHFAKAPGGIKFALGENVKQSNWGDDYTTRYPQTRMGVETLMRDRFNAAREYMRVGGRRKIDLELEALAEILRGERLIHCHSYRQDEILMLCRIAGDFGFKIGTFQHVLEGYKVADEIAKHALGGSAFSDWWAYKVEVQDAIPYNGALMHEVGVVVSFNSDSDDLVRRLNTEAAKAIKYGGLSREDAFRFVTLNPAKQLKIDHLVGSIEKGKHADLALWNGDPMSTFTRCVGTWVDGERLYSEDEDREQRKLIASERKRLIDKLVKRAHNRPHTGDKERGPIWWMKRAQHAACGLCGTQEVR